MWNKSLLLSIYRESALWFHCHFFKKQNKCHSRDEMWEGRVAQLCTSLGFLLSTSSSRGQIGIIRLGWIPARPLWCGHGMLVCLFKLWLNSVHSLVKEGVHWQIVGRLHREAIHSGRKELRTLPRKWSSLNILMERLWMPSQCPFAPTNKFPWNEFICKYFSVLYVLNSINCNHEPENRRDFVFASCNLEFQIPGFALWRCVCGGGHCFC